eukprot:scaffold107444_cov28-Tisochrysis_lutea.AAC.2
MEQYTPASGSQACTNEHKGRCHGDESPYCRKRRRNECDVETLQRWSCSRAGRVLRRSRLCTRQPRREPSGTQQQPPPVLTASVFPPTLIFGLPPSLVGAEAMRFLISPAIVMKASSTLVAFFAEVSRNGMLTDCANSLAVSDST